MSLTGYTPPSLAQLTARASALAKQQVAAQVAAVKAQQQAALEQARQRAAQINSASLAAANFLKPLEGLARSDYANAVKNEAGIAQGYSGQAATDAKAAADQAQATLASVPGIAQKLTDRGPSLANLLYGLGGALPAHQLNVAGLGAVSAARALPAAALGYGSEQAAGAYGAGKQTADSLAGQIIAAQAQIPSLTSSHLTELQGAARDEATIQALIAKQAPVLDPARSHAVGYQVDQFGAPLPDAHGRLQPLPGYKLTADGTVVAIQKPVKPSKPSVVSGSPNGVYTIDPVTGQATQVVAPTPKAAKPNPNAPRGGLTANEWTTLKGKTTAQARDFYHGVAPQRQYVPAHYDSRKGHQDEVLTPAHWIPVPGTGSAPVQYADAVAQLLASGPQTPAWTKYVMQTVNSLYAPGEGGRPKSAAQVAKEQRAASAKAARDKAVEGAFTQPAWLAAG